MNGVTVCLGTQDMAAALRCYVDGLGLQLLQRGTVGGPGYSILWGVPADQRFEACVVGLPGVPHGRVRIVEAALPPPSAHKLTDLGVFDVDFWARDLDATCASVRAAGFAIWTDPLAYSIGTIQIREAIVEAPDRVRSAIIQETGQSSVLRDNPTWPVSEATITAAGVPDVDTAVAFYRDAFDLTPTRIFSIQNRELNQLLLIPDDVTLKVALLDMPHTRIELIESDQPGTDIRDHQRPPRAGFQGNSAKVENIDDTLARCLAAGATILAGPVALPPDLLRPGCRVALLTDPAGLTLELWEESK